MQAAQPPQAAEGFLGAIIRSATVSDAQIFTEATPPFKICHANNAWTQLCGFTVAEALGKTCKILQGPETSASSLRELHAGLAAQRKTTVQLTNYTKAGDQFLNELTVEPLSNDAGDVTHFKGTLVPRPPPAGQDAALPLPPVAIPQEVPPSTVGGGNLTGGCSAAGAGAGGGGVSGAQGRGAAQPSPTEYTDLLSRGSFPLHTLNHHPNAPVLLRMLQLNNCSMRRSSYAGGGGNEGSSSSHPSPLSAGGSSSLGLPLPLNPGLQGSGPERWPSMSAMLLGQGGRGNAGTSVSPRATMLEGHSCGASSSSQPQFPVGHSNHERPSCKSDAFLAAVAGQGVLPMGSWPKPPPTPATSPKASNAAAQAAAAAHAQGACASSGHTGPGPPLPAPQAPVNRKRACDAGGRPLAAEYWDASRDVQGERLARPEQGSVPHGRASGLSGSSSSRGEASSSAQGRLPQPQPQPSFAGAADFVGSLLGCGPGDSAHQMSDLGTLPSARADQPRGGNHLPQPSRRAEMGGPGLGGQWAPEEGAPPEQLGNGEDVIELDDIFDVLDNWDEFERQPELARSGRSPPETSARGPQT